MKVFLAGRIAVESKGVVIDDRHFPGRQGRLLFAYLVAKHGRPVPRDELADVLWGDAPPATWEKALSVLVSKLRAVLSESGLDGASALTAAFGCYQLDLPESAWVDVLAAERAVQEAEELLETDELESATASAALAESVTRSPFLPGDDGPWVEERRRELAEIRARALSALAETSLRTDRAGEAVRWAGLAIEAEPFRETGYRLLMEAHAAAGNRAEALRTYDRCRRLLAEELGAYPSPETESIYRGLLDTPSGGVGVETAHTASPSGSALPSADRRKRPALLVAAFVVLVVIVAAAAVIALVGTRDEGARASSAARSTRVALVVPRSPPGGEDPSAQYQHAVDLARIQDRIRTQRFEINLSKPGLSGLSKRALDNIGNFDLVLLAGQLVSSRFKREFERHPDTRFVVLDPDPVNGSLYNAVSSNRNASDLFFIEGPGSYLAGVFSALMAERAPSRKRPVTVSMVGSTPDLNDNVARTFMKAAKSAVPGIRVLENYSYDVSDPSKCERVANQQIDRGSDVIYAPAGACSAGALHAAQTRGVWFVAADQDPSDPIQGPRILGSTTKNFGQEVDYSIRSYLDHTLPPGGHRDIGIERGAVGFIVTNQEAVPAWITARIEQVKREHMKHWRSLPQLVAQDN